MMKFIKTFENFVSAHKIMVLTDHKDTLESYEDHKEKVEEADSEVKDENMKKVDCYI